METLLNPPRDATVSSQLIRMVKGELDDLDTMLTSGPLPDNKYRETIGARMRVARLLDNLTAFRRKALPGE